MVEIETKAEKAAGMYVNRSLAWHVEGCIKRYGAQGDQLCKCELAASLAKKRTRSESAG